MPSWIDVVGGAEPQGKPIFSAPIPGVNIDYVLEQRFRQQFAARVPLALNTPHPQFGDYVLVEEGQKEDKTGNEVEWPRKYAKVPAQHVDMGTFNYTFIGYLGRVQYNNGVRDPSSIESRNRIPKTVIAKVQYDYFLTDGTAANIVTIPVIQHTRYLASGIAQGIDVDYIAAAGSFGTVPTIPTVEDYLVWIGQDAATASSFHIVVEDSAVTRWMGNIFVRTTKYIKAL